MQQRCVHDGIKINLHHLTLLHIAESFFRTAIHPVPIRLNKNGIAHTDGNRFCNKRIENKNEKIDNIYELVSGRVCVRLCVYVYHN